MLGADKPIIRNTRC